MLVIAEDLWSLNEACKILGGLRWLELGGTVQDKIHQRIFESSPWATSAKSTKVLSHSGPNKLVLETLETLETLVTLELIAYFITCQSVCYSNKTNQLGFFPSFLLV